VRKSLKLTKRDSSKYHEVKKAILLLPTLSYFNNKAISPTVHITTITGWKNKIFQFSISPSISYNKLPHADSGRIIVVTRDSLPETLTLPTVFANMS
jgi:hypothetical protein